MIMPALSLLLALPVAAAGTRSGQALAQDTDGDGVLDADDRCAWIDDSVDLDENGEADCVETFVAHAHMNDVAAVTAWDRGSSGAGWITGDANGYASSGNLRIEVDAIYHQGAEVFSACMAVTPGAAHVLLGRVRIARTSGTLTDHKASIYLEEYASNADCQDKVDGVRDRGELLVGQTDGQWVTAGTRFSTRATTRYARVVLAASVASYPGYVISSYWMDTIAYFDNILLHDSVTSSADGDGVQ